MDFLVRARPGSFEPNADVFIDEERGCLVAVIEVAGADAESVRIGLDERDLIIAGRRLENARLRRGSLMQKEIAYGAFFKRIPLPVPVENHGAGASYADGLLVVVLPVAAAAYRSTARTELQILVKRTHS
jgi:HSP20 family protein